MIGVLALVTTAQPDATWGAGCVLDVDGDGVAQPGTDVVYIARHLLTLAPVPPSFREGDPGIATDVTIGARVDALRPGLDVDADTRLDVATDIVYVARHLLDLAPVPPSFRAGNPSIPSDAVLRPTIDACRPGLPADVTAYRSWLRLNADPIPPRSNDPHAGTKNVFVNQPIEVVAPGGQQRFPYPDGSIVVKAVTRPGRDFIGLFATMRKRAGQDPAHGDWAFVEYARESVEEPFAIVAQDGICWGCHVSATTFDWVFTPLD